MGSKLGGEFYDGVKGIFLPDGRFSSPVKDLDSVEEYEQPILGARWGGGGRKWVASLRKAKNNRSGFLFLLTPPLTVVY